MHRRHLELAQPCTQDWAEMKGTSTVRHCTNCSKSVFNLSMLTEREANAALAVRPSKVCVIYYVDAEDRVAFHPEEAPSRWSSQRHTLAAAVAASALAACSAPAAIDRELSPVAIANAEPESPATSTPAFSASAAAPVDAGVTASNTHTTETEACDPRWKDAFNEKGRSTQHLRDAVPNPGGLPTRDNHYDELMLNPYARKAAPAPAPEGTNELPNRDEVIAGLRKAQAIVRATCKGEGVATADMVFAGRTGRVTDVRVTGVAPADAVCVEKATRRIKLSKFASKVFAVKFPFTLKG